jgi:hypothetical protein
VAGDRLNDGGVPPGEHGRRRDNQGGRESAEPRTRQEYYVQLQRTLAKERSVRSQRITAEEQAASDKWDEDAAESRSMWEEYQQKWPPEERPQVDRSDDRPGTWRGDSNGFLRRAANRRVEAECDRIVEREKGKISPALRAVESQDPDRHLAGFEHRRKGRDRIKEKVHGTINDFSRSPEQAVSLVPDAIRYTFQYREASYTHGVWSDIERLKGQGFELDKLKNLWSGDQYKGINSQWTDRDTGQKFEVQFHTRISFEAKQLTHKAYERLRERQPDNQTPRANRFERMVLEAFQQKVTADVPVPPGAVSIPDYP